MKYWGISPNIPILLSAMTKEYPIKYFFKQILKGKIPLDVENTIWENISLIISKMNEENINEIPKLIASNTQKILNTEGKIGNCHFLIESHKIYNRYSGKV